MAKKLIELVNSALTLDPYRAWQDMHASNGACVEFIGSVKQSATLPEFKRLRIDAYEPMTKKSLQDIADNQALRFNPTSLLIIHAFGTFAVGETIVYVSVSSNQRAVAFDCCRAVVEDLKTKAILWKKEIANHSSTWIAPVSHC